MTTHRADLRAGAILLAGCALSSALAAALAAADTPRRARPPVWNRGTTDVFFPDARAALDGDRPNYAALRSTRGESRPGPDGGTAVAAEAGFRWSTLITADTLETEVKQLAKRIQQDVTTPSAFKGGGYKNCRDHFSLLATLFAVAAEYDLDVRWKDAAPGLRDLFARAGYNCKVGTDQTYREAKLRREDLTELIRGGRPETRPAERAASWNAVADRPPLMKRLETSAQEILKPAIANAATFRSDRDSLLHEAGLMALLAQVIVQEGYEYADDEAFRGYANELRDAALKVTAAGEKEDYAEARAAVGRATQACSACHEDYRG